MKRAMPAFLTLLLADAGAARAEDAPAPAAAQGVQPFSPEPEGQPPPPPQQPPPPPQQQVQAQQPPTATGQWIYTAQYGWVWMPYGPEYLALAAVAGAVTHAYVYHPPHGWLWLAAPWVHGWGASPHFGSHDPAAFSWYHSDLFRDHHSGGHRGGGVVVHGHVRFGHGGGHGGHRDGGGHSGGRHSGHHGGHH